MPVRSAREPWWVTETFREFERYGYVISAQPYGDVQHVTLALQPPGQTYDACRIQSYRYAEQALALAKSRYKVVVFEFRISYREGYPIEPVLELTLDKKDDG